jgi:hypothetical protein
MALPAVAAFRHQDAREGFEVVFVAALADGFRIEGHTSAVEEGEAWAIGYTIVVDRDLRTRHATVTGRTRTGSRAVTLEATTGGWLVDGAPAPHLDGCCDVDLESSAFTNAFPVRRLRLAVGAEADAPAAYVRALDLRVERLEQRYRRIEDAEHRERYAYVAPAFDTAVELVYDEHGVVLDYPGIAVRVS